MLDKTPPKWNGCVNNIPIWYDDVATLYGTKLKEIA
jgi:hypothetical protein